MIYNADAVKRWLPRLDLTSFILDIFEISWFVIISVPFKAKLDLDLMYKIILKCQWVVCFNKKNRLRESGLGHFGQIILLFQISVS